MPDYYSALPGQSLVAYAITARSNTKVSTIMCTPCPPKFIPARYRLYYSNPIRTYQYDHTSLERSYIMDARDWFIIPYAPLEYSQIIYKSSNCASIYWWSDEYWRWVYTIWQVQSFLLSSSVFVGVCILRW